MNNDKGKGVKKSLFIYIGIIILFFVMMSFAFKTDLFADFINGFNLLNPFNKRIDDPSKPVDDGKIKYLSFDEVNDGIKLVGAYPVNDLSGKKLEGEDYTFDFKVDFGKNALGCQYEVVAVKDLESTLLDQDVKVYLTTKSSLNSTDEYEVPFSINELGNVKTFDEYEDVIKEEVEGKIIFSETVTSQMIREGSKYFTLRIWLNYDGDFAKMAEKVFGLKLNFYATE